MSSGEERKNTEGENVVNFNDKEKVKFCNISKGEIGRVGGKEHK